jgi:hypothetical protein
MIRPGTRQRVAALIASYLAAPVRPIEPMASPCLPGFLTKRQAV